LGNLIKIDNYIAYLFRQFDHLLSYSCIMILNTDRFDLIKWFTIWSAYKNILIKLSLRVHRFYEWSQNMIQIIGYPNLKF